MKLFFRIPWRRQIFFVLNFCLCGMARLSIRMVPLPRLSRFFGILNQNIVVSTVISKQQRQRAAWIGRSIRLAATYTPWKSTCLTQAMVARFWCWVFGIPYGLYIGFSPDPSAPNGYKAHAWVTAGAVLMTGGNGFLGFSVVSSYFGASQLIKP